MDLIKEGKADKVLIEFKDRLTRFGFLEADSYGVTIEVAEKRKVKLRN